MEFTKLQLAESLDLLLEEYDVVKFISSTDMLHATNNACNLAWLDLQSYVQKDPANKGSMRYVFESCKCFRAVMTYRLAHEIEIFAWESEKYSDYQLSISSIARCMSEDARVRTGVEIHPKAKIGKKFVVDHGSGTVIGETCEIGDDCYILQSVLLGASRISMNSSGKRHPTLGNNVEIGSFSKLLGAIKIGDNVSIGTGCLIISDIPDNCRVSLYNEYQVTRNTKSRANFIRIYGFNIISNDSIMVFGEGFNAETLNILVLDNHCNIIDCSLSIELLSDKEIVLRFTDLSFVESILKQSNNSCSIKLEFVDSSKDFSIIVNCFALDQIIRSQIKKYL